jgi:hypothetical protein
MNTESTELVIQQIILPQNPAEVGPAIRNEFEKILGKVRDEVINFKPDVSSDKGRKAIASIAHKIARTKTGLDDTAAKLIENQKAVIDAVNAERRAMRTHLDNLKEEVRKPLTDWEQAEARRQTAINETLQQIDLLSMVMASESIEFVRQKIEKLRAILIEPEIFKEITVDVLKRRDDVIVTIENTVARMEKEAAEREELARLRAEAEQRAAEDRARAEKAERDAAEAARLERERVAEAERALEAERRKFEEEKRAKEQAEAEAERRVREALAETEAAKQRAAEAEARALRAAEEERERLAAIERQKIAEQARLEAARKVQDDMARRSVEELAQHIGLDCAQIAVDVIRAGKISHIDFVL